METKNTKNQKILIYTRNTENSLRIEDSLTEKFIERGFSVTNADESASCDLPREEYDLIVCIGGDGTFLRAIHMLSFPETPIIGINTGHLGFFQEIMPDEPGALDLLIDDYLAGRYSIQSMQTVKAIVKHCGSLDEFIGLNEIIVKSSNNYTIHLNISIGGSFIERFSGDGVLISTPAGSTAYNYSLGGSIVDPRIRLLQITPMAPMNTTAYRSFTSSLLLPPDLSIEIVPGSETSKGNISIAYDGFGKDYDSIDEIRVMLSDTHVNLMRFDNYDFWNKVKTKFL